MELDNILYTSTPIRARSSKSHRRSTPLQDITNTSLRKRRHTNLVNQSFTVQPEVDDELERSIRRSKAEIIRRLSYLSSSSSPNLLDEKQIQDHFQICLKMYAENKINAKNVWNLKIIDYMRTVLYSHGLNKNSLQVAGTSLDVSAKIYGLRVDDIHTAILKLASSMARIYAQKEAENAKEDESENENPEEGNKSRTSRGRRKNKIKKTTIAKDPNTLLGDVPKLESVFFQTHINLESSSVDNLFTNKFPMNHGRYKFMFLSKETAWASYNKKDGNISFNTRYPCRILEIRNFEICSPFYNFEINEWDPEQEARMLDQRSRITIEFQTRQLHGRSQTNIEANEVVYDENGFAIPELDGSVYDIFENGLDKNPNKSHGAVLAEQVTHIEDFNPGKHDLRSNEYCYTNAFVGNNKLMIQVWAGPSHWKLKYIRKNENQFSGKHQKQCKKAAKRNKIQPSLIDYNMDMLPYDKTQIYKPKNIKIDTTPYKCTLPNVMHMERVLYRSLMLKPCYLKLGRHSSSGDDGDPEVNSYNYENPNDNLYCSQQQTDITFFTDIGNDHHQNEEETVFRLSQQNFQKQNLIAMPELVPQSYIAYALRPKRMDMKRLKKAVWRTLVNIKPDEMVSNESLYMKEVQKKTFSEIYQEIPSMISVKMQKELSCPLVFVALLHLCNEQNLELRQESDLGDLTVETVKHFQP